MTQNLSPLASRAVIAVTGPDAISLLQRVVTGDVEAAAPGRLIASALLTPQGKILADFLIHPAANGVYLDVEAGAAPGLAKRLSMYKLRAAAEIAIREDLAALWSLDEFEGAGRDPRSEALGFRGIGAASGAPGDAALSRAEIAAGVPAFGRDYGEADIFPTDVNLDLHDGVAWNKGCYIGQEVVSRMKRRGNIRKRSLRLTLSAPAEKGAAVMAGGSTLGEITSSDGLSAIALIRLDRWEKAEGRVLVEGGEAEILRPDWLEQAG